MYWKDIKKSHNQVRHFYFLKKMKAWKFLPVFILSIFYFGCASVSVPKVEKISINHFEAFQLSDGTRLFPKSADETIPDSEILYINHEIKALLDDKVVSIRNPEKRLKRLAKILVENISYDMVYDRFGIKTAQETFDTGTGNCLSFSNLFVAMARYVGLRTEFQEIPTLPNWSREGELLFFTRHIGASVDIYEHFKPVVQIEYYGDSIRYDISDGTKRYFFTPSNLTPNRSEVNPYSYRLIPDNTAFAQFYNNIGSKQLAEGNNAEAFRYFVKAIKTDPELSYAWSNLGIVYRRNSQYDASEAAYLQGITVTRSLRDISILTIMNNLANLYEIKGNTEKAAFYERQVASFREKNPYYKYVAARTAFLGEYYDMSIKRYKEAIRLKGDEHLFYYGLALAYLKTGDVKKAEKNINMAMQHSWSDEKKAYYKSALNKLDSQPVN